MHDTSKHDGCKQSNFFTVTQCKDPLFFVRLLPTDISHQTTFCRYASRSVRFWTERFRLVCQECTLYWGLGNTLYCEGQKVRSGWSFQPHQLWCESVSYPSLNVTACLLSTSLDCGSSRWKASTFAALHRGRPPERPLSCRDANIGENLQLITCTNDKF